MMLQNQKRALVQQARRTINGSLAYAILTAAIALPAWAESACVQCSGPDASYTCNAYDTHPIPGEAVALFCTRRIADDYGHKVCAVERNAKTCTGLAVHFTYMPEDTDVPPIEARRGAQEKSGASAEPETLGELAKDGYDASKETVKNTGKAIGQAAKKAGTATVDAIEGAGESINKATKKTIECLGSALSNC
jgi:hypothetical protein